MLGPFWCVAETGLNSRASQQLLKRSTVTSRGPDLVHISRAEQNRNPAAQAAESPP